jgi:hypothetical protein
VCVLNQETLTLVIIVCSNCSGEFGGKAFKREIAAQWARKGPRPELREMIEKAMKVLPDEVLDARIEDELIQQEPSEANGE